jgi:hypothetical protein
LCGAHATQEAEESENALEEEEDILIILHAAMMPGVPKHMITTRSFETG